MPEVNENENNDNTFTGINPETLSSDLQEIYKSMQADYTRKTQGLADEKKTFTESETAWKEQLKELGGLEKEVAQWRTWYKTLNDEGPENDPVSPSLKEPTPSPDPSLPSYLEEPTAEKVNEFLKQTQTANDKRLTDLQSSLDSVTASMRDLGDQTNKMFSYHSQLNELASAHKGLNKQELLDYALKEGLTDLDRAYQMLHHDELLQAEVELKVKEELDKRRTEGIKGPGQQVVIKRSSPTPKTFADATDEILRERAAEGLG